MKNLLFFLVTLTLLTWATWLAWQDPGFVVAGRGRMSVEMSLPIFFILLLLLVALLSWILRLLGGLYRLPGWWRQHGATRQAAQAHHALHHGIAALAEGRWPAAEQILAKNGAEFPHWLGAALAAHQAGRHAQRDGYMQQTLALAPAEYQAAIHVAHARLCLSANQIDNADYAVRRAYALQPKNPEVLRTLADVLIAREDWDKLAEWLPELAKRKVYDAQAQTQVEQRAWLGQLHQAMAQGPEAAARCWKALTKTVRAPQNGPLAIAYARYLQRLGQGTAAEPLVREALKSSWEPEWVRLYGTLEGNADEQLAQAENWLKKYPADPSLLYTLGLLCIRARMLGKAQEYLQQSLNLTPAAHTCLALGDLLEQLGDSRQAAKYYRQGTEASR